MKNGLKVTLTTISVVCIIFFFSSVFTVLIVLLLDNLPGDDGIRIDNDHYYGTPITFLKPKLDPDDPLNVSFSLVVYCKEYQGWTTYIDLGDGSPIYNLTSNLTVHRYPSLRTYNVSYWTFFGPTYHSSTKYIRLELAKAGNMTPVPVIFQETIRIRFESQPVLFSGNASYDVDGSITGYYWDYGDGTHSPTDNEFYGYFPSKIANHIYNKRGKYIVSLRVMDDQGFPSSDLDSTHIEVYIL